ncbi:MAG: class I poly(R)-hydroxyalkanoic acid synthase, partial [Parvibaculum sp.]
MNLKETSAAPEAKEAGAAPGKRKPRVAAGKTKAAKPASVKKAAAKQAAPEKPAAEKPAAVPESRDFVMPDLGRLAINLLHAANLGQKAARQLMRNGDSTSDTSHALHDLQRVGKTLMDVAGSYLSNPAKIVEAQASLWEGYMSLAANMTRRLLGEDVPPVAAPGRSDKRFRDPDWQENI